MIRQSQTQSIAALVAEYDTIVSMAEGPRWDEVLIQSGLTDTELAQAKSSPAYASLLTQLRDADNRGFDVHTELPLLVMGRSFGDADDVASVLHYRIDRYLTGVGYPAPSANEMVAGLFPRLKGITDPDVRLALDDRAGAIEQRARTLAEEAIERGDPWVSKFGDTPATNELHERWVLEVAAGAAYFDRWKVDDPDTLLDDAPVSHEQEAQRSRVFDATQRAITLTEVAATPTTQSYEPMSVDLSEPPIPYFEFDR
jgi:hypothetical protein